MIEKNADQAQWIDRLDLEAIPAGVISRFWVGIIADGLGARINVPVMIAKGLHSGPIVGLTAAVHGNELNGIPIVQRVFRGLNPMQLYGTVVGVPVVNVPAYLMGQRKFNDGVDLNHIMPGKEDGTSSEIYAFRLIDRIISRFDYLVDIHTASFGRMNSYYIRADMDDPVTAKMALLQGAQIIVNNPPHDGTLRGAAGDLGIPAITLEAGDPHTFQRDMIDVGIVGINNLLVHLEMIAGDIVETGHETALCSGSYWIYTTVGGILEVFGSVGERVCRDQRIALVRDVFGNILREYFVPEDGIIIGRSIDPVNQTGSRILHLGRLAETYP